MNTIKFSDYTKSPFRTEDAAMLQEMTALVAEALTGSNNASLIMKGCELSGNVISAGIICLGGEIMRADPGLKNQSGDTKYIVVETKETVVSQTTTYTDYVISRKAVIDNVNGNFIWDTAARYYVNGTFSETKNIETFEYNASRILYLKRIGNLLSLQGAIGGAVDNNLIAGDILLDTGLHSKSLGVPRFIKCYYESKNLFFYATIDDSGIIKTTTDMQGTQYGGKIIVSDVIEF